jgi:hypothetical protein
VAKRSKKKAPPRPGKARKAARQKPLFAGLATPVVKTHYLQVRGSKATPVRARGSKTDREEYGSEYVTMQLEWMHCGRCPKAHGPYWTAYKRTRAKWPDKGRLIHVYVGKVRDDAKAVALLRARGAFR